MAILAGVLLADAGPPVDARLAAAVCAAACATAWGLWLREARAKPAGDQTAGRWDVRAWPVARAALPVVCASVSFAAGGAALTWQARLEAFEPEVCRALATSQASTGSPCALVTRSPVVLDGVLREDAATAGESIALSLDVVRVVVEGRRQAVRGGILLRVAGSLAAQRAGEWRAGRVVRVSATLREPGVFRDPGVPDARKALARRGTALVGNVKSASLVEVIERGSVITEWAAALRAFTRQVVDRYVGCWNRRSATIVVAILIGDRAGLENEVQRRLQEAGTYHVIAISGGNIAILAGVLLFLCRVCRLGPRGGSALAIVGLALYAAVVGGEASVARATLMAVVYFGARLIDLRVSPLNVVSISAALLLIVWPFAVFDVGFLLTFGATASIIIAADAGKRWWTGPWWRRAVVGLLLASVAAELALLPIAARAFSRVTFAGLLVNFAAIPLMTVAQVAGMALVASAAVSEWTAVLAGLAAHLGAEGLVRSAALIDVAPWLSYRLPPPHLITVAGYYAALGTWLLLRRPAMVGGQGRVRRRWRRVAAAGAACAGAWILIEPVTWFWPGVSGRLRVTFLDVGHADAILVQLPDRRSLLVDAGGSTMPSTFDIGGRLVAPALWALGTRRLDALVLTHPDPDHIGGAISVIRDFRPREIWEGVAVPRLQPLQAIRDLASARGIAWVERRAGDTVPLGSVTATVWHPPPPEWERQKARNDDSIVLELRYGEVSLLLPGDIGTAVERDLAARLTPVRLRALKVPHHGSATSSSQVFLDAAAPHVAVLTAGQATRVNAAVLERYQALDVALFRTDRDGAVTIESDGRECVVATHTGRRLRVTPRPP